MHAAPPHFSRSPISSLLGSHSPGGWCEPWSYFDPVAFEAELAGLPVKYAPPRGQQLLATVAGQPAGCVALREIDSTCCEMKRMFIYPEHHGHGIGRALAEAVIRDARAIGHLLGGLARSE